MNVGYGTSHQEVSPSAPRTIRAIVEAMISQAMGTSLFLTGICDLLFKLRARDEYGPDGRLDFNRAIGVPSVYGTSRASARLEHAEVGEPDFLSGSDYFSNGFSESLDEILHFILGHVFVVFTHICNKVFVSQFYFSL
jgi:hypothetical protein